MDDKIHTHRLFRYLIGNVNNGYGAEAWVAELQRMGERSASFFVEKIPDHDSGGGNYTFCHLYSKTKPVFSLLNYSYLRVEITVNFGPTE